MMGFELSSQPEQFPLNPERPPIDQFLFARIEPQSNPTSIGKDPASGRGVAVGRISYELVIGWNEQGRWTTGTVRLLPHCAAGQTRDCSTHEGPAWLWIYPPILPDFGLRGDPLNAVFVGQGLERVPASASVNWADLLAETVWNGRP